MYRSTINIQHGCLTHLFWGREQSTSEYIHIRDVEQNGLGCNCRCPVCSVVFIACMGEKNRPHFKHQSKYKCMYTDEITTYLRAKKVLENATSISLPSILVRFGKRNFKADGHTAQLGGIIYHCDENQYPPLLMAMIDQRPTRILLAFEGYFNSEDFALFQNEAVRNQWDCLMVDMPRVDGDDCISNYQLQTLLLAETVRKSWLHSEQRTYWQKRLEDCSIRPAKVIAGVSEAYACPLHKQLYQEQYFASLDDCEKCQFNLAASSDCRCAASTGITCISDFDVSDEIRQYQVEKLRHENEQAIIIRKQAEELEKQAEELAKQEALKEAEQRKIGFYLNKTCPKCGKQLTKRLGMKGVYWLCFGNLCDFHAFENNETGELITHGMDQGGNI